MIKAWAHLELGDGGAYDRRVAADVRAVAAALAAAALEPDETGAADAEEAAAADCAPVERDFESQP